MPFTEPQGGVFGAPDSGPRKVWFTGYKNDGTTALAKSSTNGGLIVGSAVCFTDITTGQNTKAIGVNVTKPETAILALFAGIVTSIDTARAGQVALTGDGSGVTAGNMIPGWITVVSASAAIQCFTKSNMTKPSGWADTTPVALGCVDNSWCLQTKTMSIASANANTLALMKVVAIPLETFDSSSLTEPDSALFSPASANTNLLKYVRLGGIIGGLES